VADKRHRVELTTRIGAALARLAWLPPDALGALREYLHGDYLLP